MPATLPERIGTDATGIARAGALLAAGRLVAFPTETVYGLGADACNGRAVAGIFEAKQRPGFNPLIVHVTDIAQARALARWSPLAQTLAAAFWPGPLTLVLPLREGHGLSPLVTAGLGSVALRVPESALARAVIDAAQTPVAAPSANPSGRISPTSPAHVAEELGNRIDAIVWGDECRVGVESTILSLLGAPSLLRPGAVTSAQIAATLGRLPDMPRPGSAAHDPAAAPPPHAPVAPGQLASHYAPSVPVRINAIRANPGEVHLGFGPVAGDLSLSPGGDLREAAANLFSLLHRLDAQGRPIAVAPVPDTGIGTAINDRLTRAAATRPESA